MKKLSIILFALMLVTVFNCKKDDVDAGEVVDVIIAKKPINLLRSTGFNGATAFEDSVDGFETIFNKGGDCEVYGQFARMQAGTRKSNKVIFFLDYDLGMDVEPVGDGRATMYAVNSFRWYKYNGNRWRISINGDDIAEFTMSVSAYQAIVGINMCGNRVKTITFEPAFMFYKAGVWKDADDIFSYGGARGNVVIDVEANRVVISER